MKLQPAERRHSLLLANGVPRIELFARQSPKGWDVWGNEVDCSITLGKELLKRKYITFGIEADSLRTAKPKLERIETDILNNFKPLGVKTEPLSGYERLKVLHDVFNMDTNEPFRFSFDMVPIVHVYSASPLLDKL